MTAVQAARLTLAFSYAEHDLCDMLRELHSSHDPACNPAPLRPCWHNCVLRQLQRLLL